MAYFCSEVKSSISYLEVFECLITIFPSDIDPQLQIIVFLVGEEGLGDEGIKDYLAFDV